MMVDNHAHRDREMSLERAAEMLATNRTYLSQVVNERAGQSFPAYVNTFRMEEAIQMLSDVDNNEAVKSIALSCGFSNPSVFSVQFRQKMGMSPSDFRKSVRTLRAHS